MKALRRIAIVLAVAGLAACSAVKFGYNRADWLASWEFAHFVDLQRDQKQLFDERFRELWRWHRRTQLALYARDLRQVASDAERPLTAAQVEQYLVVAQGHVDRTVDEALPDTARVLQSLDDRQVKDLLAEMAERREERAKESAGLTADERREQAQERMARSARRWIGSLTSAQQRRIEGWSRERIDADAQWRKYEETWAAAFAGVLDGRRETGFAARLAALFDDGGVPGYAEVEKLERQNRALWVALVADLSASLEPRQRQRLREQVRDLAADLEDLAAQAGMG